MSAEATAAVFRLKFSNASARLVLLSLADHHNRSTGKCFPSVKTMMDDTCLSRPTVFRALEWLVTKGLIKREASHEQSGRQTSNIYELSFLLGGGSQIDTGRVSDRDGGGSQSDTGEGLRTYTPLTGRRNKEETETSSPSQAHCAGHQTSESGGDDPFQADTSQTDEPPALPLPQVPRSPSRKGRKKSAAVKPEVVEYTKPYLLAWRDFAKVNGLPVRREVTQTDLPDLLEVIRMINSWEDFPNGIDGFRKGLDVAAESDWLMGKKGPFELSFSWLIKPANFQDVIGGKFRNRTGPRSFGYVNGADTRGATSL